MIGDDVQALLDALAGELGAALALEDTDQRLLAHTDQGGAIDDVRLASILGRRATPEVRAWFEQWGIREADAPVRTPADPSIGALARWCVPVGFRGQRLGYVWVLDDGRLPASALAGAVDVAAQVGAALYRRRLADRADAELVRLVVLPGDEPDGALADAYAHRGPIAVVVLGAADGADLERGALTEAVLAARRAGEQLPPGATIAGAVGGLAVAVVPLRAGGETAPARRLAAAALPIAARQARGLALVAGVGGASAVGSASRSHAEARRALRVARAIPSLGPVAAWDDLGVFRALALVPPDQVESSVLDPRVRDLLARPQLAATAEALLDHAGDVARTAAALGIHRATLYQRLDRIATTTRLDLRASGDDRLVAHLGLRLARLAGLDGG